MKYEFKIGDRIIGISGDIKNYECLIVGDIGDGFILKVIKNYPHNGYFEQDQIIERKTYWRGCLKLLGTGEEKLTTNNKNYMSKITTYLKNIALSTDEKLLRKHGFKTECGEYTEEAKNTVLENLTKNNEAYLFKIAQGLEDEETSK